MIAGVTSGRAASCTSRRPAARRGRPQRPRAPTRRGWRPPATTRTRPALAHDRLRTSAHAARRGGDDDRVARAGGEGVDAPAEHRAAGQRQERLRAARAPMRAPAPAATRMAVVGGDPGRVGPARRPRKYHRAESPMSLHVGTSGWAYPEWKPDFYPDGAAPRPLPRPLRARCCRPARSTRPTTACSPEDAVARWAAETPAGFRFAAKAHRRLTHARALPPADGGDAFLARFLESLTPLGVAPRRRAAAVPAHRGARRRGPRRACSRACPPGCRSRSSSATTRGSPRRSRSASRPRAAPCACRETARCGAAAAARRPARLRAPARGPLLARGPRRLARPARARGGRPAGLRLRQARGRPGRRSPRRGRARGVAGARDQRGAGAAVAEGASPPAARSAPAPRAPPPRPARSGCPRSAGTRASASAGLIGRAVGARAGHRVPRVGQGDDGRALGDPRAVQAVRVPAPVPALVVVAHPGDLLGRQHVRARSTRRATACSFRRSYSSGVERAGLEQDRVRDADLADVVDERRLAQQRDALGVQPSASASSRGRSATRSEWRAGARRRGRRPRAPAPDRPASACGAQRSACSRPGASRDDVRRVAHAHVAPAALGPVEGAVGEAEEASASRRLR